MAAASWSVKTLVAAATTRGNTVRTVLSDTSLYALRPREVISSSWRGEASFRKLYSFKLSHKVFEEVMLACNSGLLHRSEVAYVYREPYIMSGYRRPGCSLGQSIRYAFVAHNDVGNFWSHFVAVLAWIYWYRCLPVDFGDAYYHPLWCFWAGACSYVLFSSMAHLFSAISFPVRTVCFVLDYLGISLSVFGCTLSTLAYQPLLSSVVVRHKPAFVLLGLILAMNATVICSLSRFYWKRHRFVIRAFAYVLPYTLGIFPICQRLWFCFETGEECVPETLGLHFFALSASGVLIFFFVSKFPERCAPGRFDLLFQSHQLFHLTCVALTCSQMIMFPRDAQLRRQTLSVLEDSGAVDWSLPAFTAALVGGLAWVLLVWIFVAKGYLHSNDKDKKG